MMIIFDYITSSRPSNDIFVSNDPPRAKKSATLEGPGCFLDISTVKAIYYSYNWL